MTVNFYIQGSVPLQSLEPPSHPTPLNDDSGLKASITPIFVLVKVVLLATEGALAIKSDMKLGVGPSVVAPIGQGTADGWSMSN